MGVLECFGVEGFCCFKIEFLTSSDSDFSASVQDRGFEIQGVRRDCQVRIGLFSVSINVTKFASIERYTVYTVLHLYCE